MRIPVVHVEAEAVAGSEWLASQAARGGRALFEAALRQVADVEPEEKDKL